MEAEQTPPTPTEQPNPPSLGGGSGMKKAAGPLAVIGALLAKFKLAIIPILKFLPVILKTGGTMFLSCWLYAMRWGWAYAFGFVLLIFVHECGHLLAAKKVGLKVGAPMFIPFVGALIALKEAPRNAWIEAQVGIGGPLLGALGATVCYGVYLLTGSEMLGALAYTGFLLNLFNLAPIGFLDGGRIVTALSPRLRHIRISIKGILMFVHFNIILLAIFLLSLPRLFSLFRTKSTAEARYFEVSPDQRWIMAVMYFGLIAFLMVGMLLSHVQVQHQVVAE